jgi:histone-lysine N-methyltransferase SETMAR
VTQFKRGDISACDAPRPGRPKTVTTPEIIDQIHEIILEDSRISAKSIAEQLDISRGRVGSIIYEDLDMRKLSAKWVPKFLNANQKRHRCQSSEQLLGFFLRDPNYFLSRLVTILETWLYHYDPETKQQSMEWRHSGSPRPKISEFKNPLENFSLRFFEIKTASSSLIIFQRVKPSTRSITYLCWCN